MVPIEGDRIIQWERVSLPQIVLTQGDVCVDRFRPSSLTVPALNQWGMDLTWGENHGFWKLRTQKHQPKRKKIGNLEFPKLKMVFALEKTQ